MTEHICGGCYRPLDEHTEKCAECGETHWPASCCPDCPCGTFERLHPSSESEPSPQEQQVMTEQRRAIAIEGKQTADGRLIEFGALKWAVPVPVLRNEGSDSFSGAACVGYIERIERETDGRIVGEGAWPDLAVGECLTIGLVLTKERQDETETMVFTDGTIGYVMIGPGGNAWPELDTQEQT